MTSLETIADHFREACGNIPFPIYSPNWIVLFGELRVRLPRDGHEMATVRRIGAMHGASR